jgi:hypothetical protein
VDPQVTKDITKLLTEEFATNCHETEHDERDILDSYKLMVNKYEAKIVKGINLRKFDSISKAYVEISTVMTGQSVTKRVEETDDSVSGLFFPRLLLIVIFMYNNKGANQRIDIFVT